MATIINININGYGVSQTTEPSPDPYRVYPLLPGFTMVRERDGFRKIKAKKKKNCEKGQVCGFGCISKTKVCTADMTTAQFKAHNEAKRQARRDKVAAKKAGGGANNAEITQAVGGNQTLASLIDIVDINVGNANEGKASKIADLYLEGQTAIRPIIVRRTGEGFDERYDVADRQDEARAHQIARENNKFFELAQSVILTDKNEAQVLEQLEITKGIKREIPETTAAKSEPFNQLKQPKNRIALFDIDSVDTQIPLSTSEQKTVETLAQNYLKIGNVDPVILRRKGTDKEALDDVYDVASGRIEFAALQRAKQLNPKFEMFKGLVIDDTNEKNVVDQLAAIYSE